MISPLVLVGWILLVACLIGVFVTMSAVPAWAFMWLLALVVFTACKWVTWLRWNKPGRRVTWRDFAYFFAWPGLDAASFLGTIKARRCPPLRDWLFAAAKTLLGVVLLWGVARRASASSPLLAGWFGLFGLIFLLHLGAFHMLALCWQWAGVDAQPIMNAPILATSLGEFWGRRWNAAFNQVAHDLVFRPVLRRFGIVCATMGAFLASGLIHELVISIPAGAGYGLPTIYFLLQGGGVLLERSEYGRRMGLRQGVKGWLLVAAFTAGPAFWLFHPAFVIRVIVPFLRAINAM